MDLPIHPFHKTLSPAAAAAVECRRRNSSSGGSSSDIDVVFVAVFFDVIAFAAASVHGRSRHCRVFVQHEAVQVRGRHHHNDEFQKEPSDQPVPIEIQNETADYHRDHQWAGLPFRLQ